MQMTGAIAGLANNADGALETMAAITGDGPEPTARGWFALVAFGIACVAIGFSVATILSGYFSLPDRVQVLESTIIHISQDLCVIRQATEGLDAVECLRRIR